MNEMFLFKFEIKNPFVKYNDFKNIFAFSGNLSKNKAWEVEAYRFGSLLFKVAIELEWNGSDHAGPKIEIALFGYVVAAQIYDTRHWDYTHNCWKLY